MPAANTKANYKSYEAQARMVRAMVAAHPEVKWNYKEIVACYGSDMTEHALNHRFRRIRAQSVVIQEGRKNGFDMKDLTTDEKGLPATQDGVDKQNIAKYFGQSTPDGIQFQFRTIKKDAETLRKTASNGGDVASALNLGSGTSAPCTPSKPTPARARGSRTTSTKRRAETFIKRAPSDDEDDDMDDIENYEEVDQTPSKRAKIAPTRGRKAGTPSRLAAVKADATIAADAAAAQQEVVESPPEIQTPSAPEPAPPMRHTSIFGQVPERKPIIQQPEPAIYSTSAFSTEPDFSPTFHNYMNGSFFSAGDDFNDADGADGEF